MLSSITSVTGLGDAVASLFLQLLKQDGLLVTWTLPYCWSTVFTRRQIRTAFLSSFVVFTRFCVAVHSAASSVRATEKLREEVGGQLGWLTACVVLVEPYLFLAASVLFHRHTRTNLSELTVATNELPYDVLLSLTMCVLVPMLPRHGDDRCVSCTEYIYYGRSCINERRFAENA